MTCKDCIVGVFEISYEGLDFTRTYEDDKKYTSYEYFSYCPICGVALDIPKKYESKRLKEN